MARMASELVPPERGDVALPLVEGGVKVGAHENTDGRGRLFPLHPGALARGEIREPLPELGTWRPGNALEWLGALFGCAPRTWLRRIPGRETFLWPGAQGDEPLVVKRFTRNPSSGSSWFSRDDRTPARREFENLGALGELGFAVPRPIAWFEERRSLLGPLSPRSAVVMEKVEHEESLRRRLEREPAQARIWIEPLVALVARLHAAGWHHRDLYLGHVALARDDRLVLLDLGRAEREERPRRRWFVKDLAALLHSCPSAVNVRARLAFLARYLDERAIVDRRERRAWARAVRRKARRIASHAPRYVDPRSVEGARPADGESAR